MKQIKFTVACTQELKDRVAEAAKKKHLKTSDIVRLGIIE